LPRLNPPPSGLTIDFANERLIGAVPNRVYQRSTNGTTWSNITADADGAISIASLITFSVSTNHFREAATANSPVTDHVTIMLPPRPVAPTVGEFIFNDPANPDQAVIVGLESGMEFQLRVAPTWTAFDGTAPVFNIPSAVNELYWIRFSGTSDTFPSDIRQITLTPRRVAPNVSLTHGLTEQIWISTNQEVSVNGGPFVAVTSDMQAAYTTGGLIVNMIDALAPGQTATIAIRLPATQTLAASNTRVITLHARQEAPSLAGLTFLESFNRITGANAQTMKWRVPGGNWTNAVASIVAPANWTTIEFALRPTATEGRSWISVFTRPEGLSAEIGAEIGFDLNEEVYVNGDADTSATPELDE